MNKDILTALVHYNAYANQRVFSIVEALDETQYLFESHLSHSSVHQMLRHMLATQRGFLAMCRGERAAKLELTGFPALREAFLAADAELQRYVEDHTWQELSREVNFDLEEIQLVLPIWKALVQVLVHAIHHRGELSILMTGLGHPLPTPDIIVQYAEQDGQTWPWM